MTDLTTSRRALLGALAIAAPAAAMASNPMALSCVVTVDRTAWDHAFASYLAALAAHEAACSALSAAERKFAKVKRRLVPPVAPEHGVLVYSRGQAFTVEEAVANARRNWEEYERAEDAFEQAIADLKTRCGVDRCHALQDAACTADVEAADVLLTTPAPDLAAVAVKMEVANERDLPCVDALADLRRLARLSWMGGQA